ncbi:MAG: DUF4174 domain-containing protein [Pseudomonadota bacterium]
MRVFNSIYRCVCAGLAIGGFGIATSQAESRVLSGFEWKNRPLIVCDLKSNLNAIDLSEITDGFRHPAIDYMMLGIKIFARDRADRDLVLIIIDRETWRIREWGPADGNNAWGGEPVSILSSSGLGTDDGEAERLAIAKKVACDPGEQMMALIGLDGDVKQIWRDAPPTPAEVFALIDAMPMRQNELRKAAEE